MRRRRTSRRRRSQDDRGQNAPEALIAEAPSPAGAAAAEPVPDHPDLAEREADEDADRIERDQERGCPAEHREEADRDGGEEDDPQE